MVDIEILSIGNELLIGKVLDTNSHWLCRQLTVRGAQVRRMVQVRDEVEAIAGEVRGVLQRQVGLLISTGGLGPTDDDRTLQGVALGLGRPLEEHPQALELIRQRYRDLATRDQLSDVTITPSRRKMAWLPQGGQPLPNPVGTAPGVVIRQENTVVVCLPGVPEELMGIFAGPLSGLLQEILGIHAYAEWGVVTSGAGESILAPLLRQVVRIHPDVYVKSMAQYPFQGQVRITLSRTGVDMDEAEAGLSAALQDLHRVLSESGISIGKVERL